MQLGSSEFSCSNFQVLTYIYIYIYIIKQLNDTNIDKELLKHRLTKREDFWIIGL